MSEHRDIKIISFVGLAGAGKTTATDYMTAKNIPKVSFGDIIRHSMERADIETQLHHPPSLTGTCAVYRAVYAATFSQAYRRRTASYRHRRF